jgi:patatin-related protein
MSDESRPVTSYESERRLAVVMYGGVSLAIYIGGVAKELLSVVRATAPQSGNPHRAGLATEELRGAEAVYRCIAQTSEGATVFPENAIAPLLRNVTIDIITGTSAGGMNGVFLAKALANDRTIDELLKLWVEEGDLAKLLNDGESVAGTALSPQDPPQALLNGRRIYAKLLDAFDGMDDPKQKDASPAKPRFDIGRVDLFVTTTDVRGEVITLPVTNGMVLERRHRQRFHFTADSADTDQNGKLRNELTRDNNPLLAFAARCTSSFPFAFEPFTWEDASSIAGKRTKTIAWTDRLAFLGESYEKRPFCDGGFLDNKPFSYAIDELAKRQSHLEVKRTLFYVEPDPETINGEKEQALRSVKPDAIETVMAALTLPGYETIREDLERVVARNGRVANLRELESTMIPAASIAPFTAHEWARCGLQDLVRRYGVGYPAYHAVKLDAVVESLTGVICTTSSIGRPELALVIRDLVKRWVGSTYQEFGDQMQLLLDADIDYRLRKIGFVLRYSGESRDSEVMQARVELKAAYDTFYCIRRTMRADIGVELAELRRTVLDDATLAQITPLSGDERTAAIKQLLDRTGDAAQALSDYLATHVRDDIREASAQARAAVGIDATGAEVASVHMDVGAMRRFFQGFEAFDMVTFPIVRNGGVDEGVHVDIVRISPRDAENKITLAGAKFGHFGGFLEGEWRRNDILWGRLNASEAIIRQLVPHREAAAPLIAKAHQAIIEETLLPVLKERLLTNATLPAVAAQLNDCAALTASFKEGTVGYDMTLDRTKQVRSAGRAGVVVEQILRSGAVKAKKPFPGVIRWGMLGAMLLTQIAIPRSFHRTVANYWGRLLALIFAVMAAAGYFADQKPVFLAGLKGFAIVSVLALLTVLVSAWVGEKFLATVYRIGSWALAIGVAAYLIKFGFTVHLPDFSQMQLITGIDVFFIGVALGLFLMSGLLAVIEDGRAAIRWAWKAIKTA